MRNTDSYNVSSVQIDIYILGKNIIVPLYGSYKVLEQSIHARLLRSSNKINVDD